MILQLKQLFDIPGETQDISFDIPPQEAEKAAPDWKFASPVTVGGRAENRAGVVTLRFRCTFKLAHQCDRCLTGFDREYCYDFSHTLVRSLNTPNDDYIVGGDNTLDVNELAISDLLLQLPTKILCREDCKGLCYVCGQNLNEGECNCP